MDVDIPVQFQQPVVFGGLCVDEFRAPQESNEIIQKSERLKAPGGEGHFVHRVIIAENRDHPVVENV